MAVGEEETDTVRDEDALFHGETLLVVPAGDAEDVAFEFVAESVARDFLGDFLFVEDAAGGRGGGGMVRCEVNERIGWVVDSLSPLIIDIERLLLPRCGVYDTQR